jgi:hypothetical protein
LKSQIAYTSRTNLYSIINKFINDEWEKLRRDQITPWVFLNSGKVFRCKDFYGKEMQYQGISFEGSPREVFWARYIEPFLEDISYRAIDQTIRFCNEKKGKLEKPILETAELLKILVRKTYELMADVDRRLRGCGYPETIGKRSVDAEVATMDRFIDDRVQSEIAMYKRPWKIDDFYKDHPFLFWFITLALGIIGAAFIKIFMG